MFDKLIGLANNDKTRDLAMTAGGMVALMAGRKRAAVGMFARGLYGLEQQWRATNAFDGTLGERWARAEAFYEETHSHPVNRWFHMAGIPMIVGGTAGLLAFKPYRPLWWASCGAFGVGWSLNFVGHGVQRSAPAFADDPLSFIAGPVWDARQVQKQLFGGGRREVEHEPTTV